MKKYPFKKIDAFASSESGGNPAGAIYLKPDEEITAGEMQAIARQLKGFVSEVGYIRATGESSFHLRYYSSEREVEFCGHATIAIMYDLLSNDELLRAKETLSVATNKGTLAVENRIANEDAVYIFAPPPKHDVAHIDIEDVARNLRVPKEALAGGPEFAVVNAGLDTLLVEIKTLDAVLDLKPELEELNSFCRANSLDVINVYTGQVADRGNRMRTRVFAPTFGYLEDPATGSGNAALGYHMLKNGSWNGEPISFEQNADRDRPNMVKLTVKQDEKGAARVLFGGGALTRIVGEYHYHGAE